MPARIPEIAWRAGVDLNPIDVRDADQLAWLETLVWPEHVERRRRLHDAARIAAADPPRIVRGDLVDEIRGLVDSAPTETHVVVFHSSILVYLSPEHREQFVRQIASIPNLTWIANEGADVLPAIAARLRRPTNGRTVLALDGEPLALVAPHGQSFELL